MIEDTKYKIVKALDTLSGLPEECGWIEYKAAQKLQPKKQGMKDIRKRVVAFLNSLEYFGEPKVIVFGISEDKQRKVKEIKGLTGIDFPEDNEWQNCFGKIGPMQPCVETGTLGYQGVHLGYVWIRANNYDGPYIDQRACPIRKGSKTGSGSDVMTADELKKWRELAEGAKTKAGFFKKTKEIIVAVAVGQYCEANPDDRALIAEALQESFQDFNIRCFLSGISLFEWVPSIYGPYEVCCVQDRRERLLRLSPDEATAAFEVVRKVIANTERRRYSPELLESVMQTLVTLANRGYEHYARKVFPDPLTPDIFERHPSWRAKIAEVVPERVLELADAYKAEKRDDSQKKEIIRALWSVAYFPQYFERAIKLLYEMGDKQSLFELLTCEGSATAANFQQRLDAIRYIEKLDKRLAFEILNQAVLHSGSGYTRLRFDIPIPEKYETLSEGEFIIDSSHYQAYYDELLNVAESADDILALLPSWLPPSPFCDLPKLASRIEALEPSIRNPAEREKIWVRLCRTPLVRGGAPSAQPSLAYDETVGAVLPKASSDGSEDAKSKIYPLPDALRERFEAVGRLFQPDDPLADARFWFRTEAESELFKTDDFKTAHEKANRKRKEILSEIYGEGGVSAVCSFFQSLPNSSARRLNMLTDLPLTAQDEKRLLHVMLSDSDLRNACQEYFFDKSWNQGLDWVKALDAELSDADDKAAFYAALCPHEEFLPYFEEQLGEKTEAYWAAVSPLKFLQRVPYAFERFTQYQHPEKAAELLSSVCRFEELPPDWLFERLMKMPLPEYVFCGAYSALSNSLDEKRLEALECRFLLRYGLTFLQAPRTDTSFWPRVIFRRIANEPKKFLDFAREPALSDEGRLLTICDAAPDNIRAWADGIEALCAAETPELRERAENWVGYVLYNAWRETDGDSLSDDATAMLEASETKRRGFFRHAYYPDGAHISQDFQADAKNRETAQKFKTLADEQRQRGHSNFADALNHCAERLLASVQGK